MDQRPHLHGELGRFFQVPRVAASDLSERCQAPGQESKAVYARIPPTVPLTAPLAQTSVSGAGAYLLLDQQK